MNGHTVIDISDVSLYHDTVCETCDLTDEALEKEPCRLPKPKTQTITVEEFKRLNEADDFLEMLYAHGVDNWIGFSDAVKEYKETR